MTRSGRIRVQTRLVSSLVLMTLCGACQSLNLPSLNPTEPVELSDETLTVNEVRVATAAEFDAAMATAGPGQTILLADGDWRNFDMLVQGNGTAMDPITVRAETPGAVILSGQSSLRLAGQHLVVSGLVFKDGYTPRAEVISFRKDSDTLAFNTQVTNTVIDGYSNPDRSQRDIWVAMYGQNNRFDFNHLSRKLNSGPTMAVRLNSPDSLNNGHVIASNYFGPRPVFGSNGGETLRIGTSHFSLEHSGTQVVNNYFDRCGGEVEIISNKSGGNTFEGNTFFKSRGTLTLRHGSDTLVEGNLFDGAGEPHTGGVRVINPRQTVRGNYFKDLTGERFSGALVVMNGVPNSPINRYHQVDGARIEDNVFDGVRRIELGEGSDAERSAVPINSVFTGNTVLGDSDASPFRIQDDMSGISFEGNTASEPAPASISSGFDLVAANAARALTPSLGNFGVGKNDTGVEWYPKPDEVDPFEGGQRISVSPGSDTLATAVSRAEAGDTLVLKPGTYNESRLINLTIPLTIEAERPDVRPKLTFQRPNLFALSDRGGLQLRGLSVSGAHSTDSSGNSFILSTALGKSGNHIAILENMRFEAFDVNRGFSVVSAAKGTFFDRILIKSSIFQDVSGTVIKLDTETDDYGIYNAEHVIIEDSQFARVGGSVVAVYRGGRDESTFGPHVRVTGSTFDNVALNGGPSLRLHGVQNLTLTDNTASNSPPVSFTITTGQPFTEISGNTVSGTVGTFLSTTDLRLKP